MFTLLCAGDLCLNHNLGRFTFAKHQAVTLVNKRLAGPRLEANLYECTMPVPAEMLPNLALKAIENVLMVGEKDIHSEQLRCNCRKVSRKVVEKLNISSYYTCICFSLTFLRFIRMVCKK